MKKKRKSMFLYYPLIYSKLVLYFFSFYAFLFFGLLADAKVLKDILQYHIVSHFSCNIGNEKDTFTYVL